MGRIPGFTNAIFPTESMPNLSLVANLGLVLFLFLVGLEVDLRYFASNWKLAISVGVAGMALPFGLGCAIAWGLYNQFRDEAGIMPIAFGTYMLFIGIAMAITVRDQWSHALRYADGIAGLSRTLPHSDRAQTSVDERWYYCALCWW